METLYKPTPQDLDRLKPRPDMLKVSGDRVFATLQGEGIAAGKPSVFLRLHFCNLKCGMASGWQCDTGYTWNHKREAFWTEPTDWTAAEATEQIKSAWLEKFPNKANPNLVITGGEPLLQQIILLPIINKLQGWTFEVETNGTVRPLEELANCQINCSPKLANSGNGVQRRYRPNVLRAINEFPNSWFKFVVIDPDDLVEVAQIVGDCGITNDKVLIMPEGRTIADTSKHIQAVESRVIKNGWKITNRNQLEWFGDKRRT